MTTTQLIAKIIKDLEEITKAWRKLHAQDNFAAAVAESYRRR